MTLVYRSRGALATRRGTGHFTEGPYTDWKRLDEKVAHPKLLTVFGFRMGNFGIILEG
jgi:hypothetical protein